VIRIAAAGDVHFAADSVGRLRPHLLAAGEGIQLLLLAGDLTRRGDPREAAVLAQELEDLPFPVVAVLGNHDYHMDSEEVVAETLRRAGVVVLEGDATAVELNGVSVGIAGVKGFGSGFAGASATEFGEPEMKAFVASARRSADELELALRRLDTPLRIALMHYSPVEGTLVGETPALWPFLGSYLLATAVDRVGADLALHGHAHAGSFEAVTAGGVRVLNVAQAVIHRPFLLLELDPESDRGRKAVSARERGVTGERGVPPRV
jgi:Icc-related predicted phosphoesterase